MAAAVAPDYFDAFGAPIVAGRSFTPAEARSNAPVAVVNEDFVDEYLGGRNAVGRRLRYQTPFGEHSAGGQQSGRWYEIVGVVRNLGMDTTRDAFRSGRGPGVYHSLTPSAMDAGGTCAVRVAFHVRGDASAFAPRVREIARGIDPALRVYDVLPLDRPIDAPSRAQRRVGRFFASVTALVAFIAVLICVAGTYSVLSFTVARQTREIGIRIALGADRRRIVTGVFSRALVQIGAGIAIGGAIWFYVIVALLGGGSRLGILAIAAGILTTVALLACAAPIRRALRIEPTEALRHAG